MSKKKTHDEFLKQLYLNNEWFRNGYFTLESEYISAKSGILVNTPYGLCKADIETLINGSKPHLKIAVDKHEYFLNMLLSSNASYKNGDFEVISKFKNVNEKITIKNKFGICKLYGLNLLKGCIPNISSSIDPTNYWLNSIYDKRGCDFDYSKVVYKGQHKKVTIRCIIHDILFEQTPAAHFQGQGCPVCGKESTNGLFIGYENIGKFYLLKCFSDDESFYKLGHTIKSVKIRYNSKKLMPYEYEVINEIEGNLSKVLYIEEFLKKKLKKERYSPKIKFSGSNTETFNLSVLSYIEDVLNKVNL